jgi:hypothetical protein
MSDIVKIVFGSHSQTRDDRQRDVSSKALFGIKETEKKGKKS